MRKDTEVITHKFDDDIVIFPLSDAHYGAIEHNKAGWESVCNQILATKNAYCVLGGDLINNATRSSISNVFEETARPMVQKSRMVEMLMPIRDRILCITTGNHEARSLKDADDDPTYDIACKLDIEDLYRPNMAFLNLIVGSTHSAYHVVVTHGSGGGSTGAAVNRIERYGSIVENLDMMIVGHTHKGAVTRPGKLVFNPRGNVVEQKEFVVVSMVSWMEYGGYAMAKMLTPASHSNPQRIVLRKALNHSGKPRIEVIW